MNPELFSAILIIVVLLTLAGYFGWRQWRLLRDLRRQTELPSEDLTYHRRQAWRRMLCCALMVIFAGLLLGSYGFGLDRAREEPSADGVALSDAELQARRDNAIHAFSVYWIFALLLLFVMVGLAAIDMLAIRNFGLRHLRKIQADRRAMLERQKALMRSDRNGHA